MAEKPIETAPEPPLLGELFDPVHVFTKLLRELHAAEVLVSLSMTGGETRRAALDGLRLARDVLADAAEVVG